MTRDKLAVPLWPGTGREPESFDHLFQDDARRNLGIRDRHRCTLWYGSIVLTLALPEVGSTSLELLRRADRDAYVDVIKQVLHDMKQRVAQRGALAERRTPEYVQLLEAVKSAYRKCGWDVKEVSAALRRIVDTSLWCAAFRLPAVRGTSESQILRSLGLTVADARNLVATKQNSSRSA